MKSVDYLIAHPLKHHVYPLTVGIQSSGANSLLITPFYNKGLGRLISKLPGNIGKKASGYYYDRVDAKNIQSPLVWQILKLINNSKAAVLTKKFDEYVAKRIESKELKSKVLVTMQDYMPTTVFAAKNAGMMIWSDQISNSSPSAITRIKMHYESAGVEFKYRHDESVNNAILSLSDIITAPSQYAMNGVVGRVNPDARLHVIPYGVENQRFKCIDGGINSHIQIVARANTVRKGGHILIDALSRCGSLLTKLASGREVRVIVVGEMESALLRQLSKSQIPASIRVESMNVPNVVMPKLIGESHLFIMPSLSEGMSLICLEAMQCGIPSIISRYCGVDCFEDGRMGFSIEPTPDELARALVDAFHQIHRWKEWGRFAAAAAQDLSWTTYEAKISSLATELLR